MSHEGIEAPTGQEQATPDRRAMLADALTQIETDQPGVVTEEDSKDRFSPNYGKPVDRARDPGGRFVAKPVDAPVQQQDPVEPQPWASAPKSWKKELAEGWGQLPPNYQQYVHEREAQMRNGIEPLLPKAQLAEAIEQVAAPYMNTIRGLGLDLPRAIGGLMQVDHGLRTLPFEQRCQLLQQTALAYGIDLSGQMPQVTHTQGDPTFHQTQQEIINLRGQFADFLRMQEAQMEEAALDQIQRFSQTAEHFDDVKPLMATLLQRGLATTIEEAYEKAIRLTPEIFDQMQSARQAQTDLEKRKAADEAAKRARAAAVSPRSATPGASKPADARDRRSVLREQLEALSERL